MEVHTGDKPFSSDVCGYRFSLCSHLNNHIQIHTGNKLYSCEVCGSKSLQNSNLKKHIQMHSFCQIYRSALSDYSSLKVPLQIYTGEKTFFVKCVDHSFHTIPV